jgi:Flp pilus assembly protein TadD
MAPEQARGEIDRLDRRVDVFGLGAILCEILTGQPPFLGQNATELLVRAAQGDLSAAFTRLDACGADAELVRLAKACLAVQPDHRPVDGAAVAAQVAAHQAGVAERLRRAELERTAAEARAQEERRRRRAQLALAAALLTLLSLGGGGAWYLRQQSLERQAEQARQETERVRREAQLARTVAEELDRLDQAQQEYKWSEAEKILERVEGRLGQGGGEELRPRLLQARTELARVRKDRAMIAKLEEARLAYAAIGENGFDPQGSRRLFAEAFAWYGLDIGQAARDEQVAAEIKAHALHQELVAALDCWARLAAPPERQRLLALAEQADDSAWRRPLRSALRHEQWDQVRRLADEAARQELPPASIAFLASALHQARAAERAVAVLRQGRLKYPEDLWLNFDLAQALHQATPARPAEAVRYYTAAQTLRPDSVGILSNLGIALKDHDQPAEAVAVCRRAVARKPDFPLAHNNLGVALQGEGKLAEAVAAYREALRLQADYYPAHSNLGLALAEQGKLAEAVLACREALRLEPEFAFAHNHLGIALVKQGKLADGVAAYRTAIRLKPDLVQAHNNLGIALSDQGQLAEAAIALREALRLKPDYPSAQYNLGVTLQRQGQLPEAAAAYREAIRLKPAFAKAHWNLGSVLREQGEFVASRDALRRAHELAGANGGLPLDAAQWLREVERFVELEPRLADILAGKARPADAAERLEFAGLCTVKHRYVAAVRLFTDAFQADATLGQDLVKGDRYNAACCAVLAAGGKGADAGPPDAAERGRWRSQALGWLREDLAGWSKRLEGNKPAERRLVASRLRDWLSDSDLADVRAAAALAGLPPAERDPWRQLWQDVAALRHRALAP